VYYTGGSELCKMTTVRCRSNQNVAPYELVHILLDPAVSSIALKRVTPGQDRDFRHLGSVLCLPLQRQVQPSTLIWYQDRA
jgi:hypothetical protein